MNPSATEAVKTPFFHFRKGDLFIEDGGTPYDMPSRLYYGSAESVYDLDDAPVGFDYVILLEDLRKIEGMKLSSKYTQLNDYVESRRTLSGGLIIRRKDDHEHGTAIFSREEYETIRQYL
ncbi:MAG: hypothetical protein QMD85_02010 [Candidatus Aenigmarchaeota archaeon]|nr:hypothetical protein [Candidatus Aenigmarchaeota archaeon]MDI6722324.1 hypothetical protein [Candidatus Aenigmarchaeota archaeon]